MKLLKFTNMAPDKKTSHVVNFIVSMALKISKSQFFINFHKI